MAADTSPAKLGVKFAVKTARRGGKLNPLTAEVFWRPFGEEEEEEAVDEGSWVKRKKTAGV